MEISTQREPEDCSGMDEIRAEIDRIDRPFVALLGTRFKYVFAAARFKTSQASVRAPERFKAMLLKRRELVADEGLNPDAIERLCSDLVNHFIDEEMRHWEARPAVAAENNGA